MDIDESRILDLFGHCFKGVDGSTGSFTACQDVRSPVIQDIIGRQTSIISLNYGANLQLFDPASRFQVAVVRQLDIS